MYRVRESLFWLGINQEIENCDICKKYQRSNQHETLIDRKIP